jgi:hypothetical protein
MTLFLHRFFGALALDAGAFEDIEADRHASAQSALVVALVCIAAGISSMELGMANPASFLSGAIIALASLAQPTLPNRRPTAASVSCCERWASRPRPGSSSCSPSFDRRRHSSS